MINVQLTDTQVAHLREAINQAIDITKERYHDAHGPNLQQRYLNKIKALEEVEALLEEPNQNKK